MYNLLFILVVTILRTPGSRATMLGSQSTTYGDCAYFVRFGASHLVRSQRGKSWVEKYLTADRKVGDLNTDSKSPGDTDGEWHLQPQWIEQQIRNITRST